MPRGSKKKYVEKQQRKLTRLNSTSSPHQKRLAGGLLRGWPAFDFLYPQVGIGSRIQAPPQGFSSLQSR